MKYLVLTVALIACGGRKAAPEPAPTPPPPMLQGKCRNVADKYFENGYWSGYTECQFEGWWWDCPTGEHRECHKRPNGQLPAEQ
jgi:hypothetical protein